MTPEERFERIEGTLEDITESQKNAAGHLREQSAEIEKQNEGIKGLIVVARTVLTSIQELRTIQDNAIQETRELHRTMAEEVRGLHKHTDEKINILIDTVDRIIRRGDNGRNT